MSVFFFLITDWVAISTKSTQKETAGYPFVNLQSMSDGPVTNSTGIPYLYMSDLDLSAIDVHVSCGEPVPAFCDTCHGSSYLIFKF